MYLERLQSNVEGELSVRGLLLPSFVFGTSFCPQKE
jgi:hypothetical protein